MIWLNHMTYFYLSILSLVAAKSWCLTANVMNENQSRNGTRWAVLVAGSNYYSNYRHQADVCHAYQLLKKGGLKDENIIVFMYDDIAFSPENPRPGVIINKPDGEDVYKGVPKDYTGDKVTAENLYAVLLGNKSALTGGSGKVLDSGPNDHIFIFYADHGSPGLLGMPSGEYVYAKDLLDVLKKKHATKTYKSMVIYVEACESGSIFDGLLPDNIGIYATTAANTEESSYATYCVADFPQIPKEYDTCLGDLYSVSWMEDCDKHDLRKETFGQQYEVVKRRTATTDKTMKSHVMQFGNKNTTKDFVFSFMGTNPANDNYTYNSISSSSISKIVSQREADLFHFWQKFHKAPDGSHEKIEARQKLNSEISQRKQIDSNINKIGKLLFGHENSLKIMDNVRPQGQPLVDDWDCFKMLMITYEGHCGRLSNYGMKYSRAIANICNAGVTKEHMIAVSNETCFGKSSLVLSRYVMKI